jgi:hypothetical protein
MALSLRARVQDLTLADVEACRLQDRLLVRTCCMRGTLHLVLAEDLDDLLSAVSPVVQRAAWRWLEKRGGLDRDRAVLALDTACRILQEKGPLTRPDLMKAVSARVGFPVQPAAAGLVHLNGLLGRICFGPDQGAHPTYASLDRWLGRRVTVQETPDFSALARRYLEGYGPAGPRDLAAWWGLGLKQAKSAWELLGDSVVETRTQANGTEAQPVWMLASPPGGEAGFRSPDPSVRLVPAFDTYLLGYANRDFAVPPRYRGRIFHGGEIVPTVLVDGCAAGTWRYEQYGKGVRITVTPFTRFTNEVCGRIAEEAEDIGHFFGRPARLDFSEPG